MHTNEGWGRSTRGWKGAHSPVHTAAKTRAEEPVLEALEVFRAPEHWFAF